MEFEDDFQKWSETCSLEECIMILKTDLRMTYDQSSRPKKYLFPQIKQETFTKWKNHITKNSGKITTQKHASNLINKQF